MTVEERAQTITKVLGGADGFWKSSTEESVFESARQLLENGWDSEETEAFLSRIMCAVMQEYGQ